MQNKRADTFDRGAAQEAEKDYEPGFFGKAHAGLE
jgi:hypothetical protein